MKELLNKIIEIFGDNFNILSEVTLSVVILNVLAFKLGDLTKKLLTKRNKEKKKIKIKLIKDGYKKIIIVNESDIESKDSISKMNEAMNELNELSGTTHSVQVSFDKS